MTYYIQDSILYINQKNIHTLSIFHRHFHGKYGPWLVCKKKRLAGPIFTLNCGPFQPSVQWLFLVPLKGGN